MREKEVIEPMGIPDNTREQRRMENVISEAAGNQNVLGERKTNFGPARITIFTAPKPFIGRHNGSQREAIASWLRLIPTPLVHLVGNHPSFYSVAEDFGSEVTVEPNVDTNHFGTPLFNSILARAQVYKYIYTMVVASDVVLLSDIFNAIKFVRHTYKNFVIISGQTEIPSFSPSYFGLNFDERKIKNHVRNVGKRNQAGSVGFWLWNNSPVPLVNASMLPFAFQRGWHDRWLANEVATAGYRALVDTTDIVTCVHPRRATAVKMSSSANMAAEVKKWLSTSSLGNATLLNPGPLRLPKWNSVYLSQEEVQVNRQLAEGHWNTTARRTAEEMTTPLRIRRFTGKKGRTYCFRRAVCSAVENLSPAFLNREEVLRGAIQAEEEEEEGEEIAWNQWLCGLYLPLSSLHQKRRARVQRTEQYHQVEDLLPLVSDERKIVTLVAVSNLYRDMLMSFVCMLRRLGLPNPLVGALDPEIYEFALEQGLAVFYDRAAQEARLQSARSGTACKYGTACFKMVTKLKSRVVLHVLKLRYSVLWSDVDIVWFRDPLTEILQYPPGTFPVQSDQPRRWQPPNGSNKTSIPGGAINSGFYFARAEQSVIEALEEIVRHAKTTDTSEQPSFFKVLCGDGESTVGQEECVWERNGLRTVFMPRLLHPNGKFNFYWHHRQTASACMRKGCATLHNNWIKGRQAKINRMKNKGLWYYDPNNRICMYKWYRQTRGLPLFFTNTDEEVEDQGPVT